MTQVLITDQISPSNEPKTNNDYVWPMGQSTGPAEEMGSNRGLQENLGNVELESEKTPIGDEISKA
ncbi:hypothetical protein FQN57_000587 [Myotisia sp. PD_48]|nr:hypothetical protein FQN57_000587 [Myotisia sp. PD_48]